nr:disease resistance protein RPH8A-like [Ziziphus jujuba var. spinosa]
MAELVLTKLAESVLSQTVERISEFLIQEAASLRSVRNDVVLLQDGLRSLKGFVRDADSKQEHDPRLRELVLQVKDVASEAEDVIETYIHKVSSSYIKAFHNKRVRAQLSFVRERIKVIFSSMQTYGIASVAAGEAGTTSSMAELQQSLRRSSPNEDDKDVIALEQSTGVLTAELTKKEDQLRIVSEELKEKRYLVVLDDIWTIAAWDSIKRAFPQGKNGSKLLFTTRNREVATSAGPSSPPIEPRVLTSEESWELLRRKAFPSGGCPPQFEELGMQMAKKCGGLPLAVIVLGGLLSTKSSLVEWERVLGDVNSYLNKVQSHQQYEGVNEILALSYYDLPYYLKPCFLYLGNFPEDSEISKRKLIRLWIGEGFIPTLTGPGDTKQRLTEQVAEGYLEELIGRCMVQVDRRDHTGISGVKTCRMHDLMGKLCISKAREENFAQVIQQSSMWIDGSAASSSQYLGGSHSRRLVIHPGVHLQYHKAHWACITFFKKLVSKNNPQSSSSSSVESNWVEHVHSNLRSLLCFGGILPLSALNSSNFRMLRMLEIPVVGASDEIIVVGGLGNLIHLRYLRLDAVNRDITLSSSIGNLRNLHILDIKRCYRVRGSMSMISRLIRLRHLLLPYSMRYNRNDFRIDKLKDIETLKNIEASVLIRLYDALHKLTNLRSISISFDGVYYNYNDDDVRRVLGSQIVQSGRLTSLGMFIYNSEAGFLSLESLSSCHSLSKLVLEGKMKFQQQQGLIHLPQSLTKLTLWFSEIEQDPMPVLENKLPNLRFLMLGWNAYVGSKMVCSAHGFPNLDTLQLSRLSDLREWIVEKGAMPSLKKLSIEFLGSLKMIPEGVKFVTSLKELEIEGMGNSFCEKLQVKNGIEGQDYYKVRHISSISFNGCS